MGISFFGRKKAFFGVLKYKTTCTLLLNAMNMNMNYEKYLYCENLCALYV